MTALTTTTTVLEFLNKDYWQVYYRTIDPDRIEYRRVVVIDIDTYEELGSPSTITVTIRPEDRLNG